MKSHIGMDYVSQNGRVDLFCFQLLNEQEIAHAVVEFEKGVVCRVLTMPGMNTKAVIRLAKHHYWRARRCGNQKSERESS